MPVWNFGQKMVVELAMASILFFGKKSCDLLQRLPLFSSKNDDFNKSKACRVLKVLRLLAALVHFKVETIFSPPTLPAFLFLLPSTLVYLGCRTSAPQIQS